MYTPRFNQVADRSVLIDAMQQSAFALLLGPYPSADPAAGPVATHLPLVVSDAGPHGLIEGHLAKANPHWQSLAGHEALVHHGWQVLEQRRGGVPGAEPGRQGNPM